MKKNLAFILIVFFCSSAFAQNTKIYISIAEQFLQQMERGQYHESYQLLDTSVTKLLSEEKNTEAWKKIHEKLGEFKKIVKVRFEETKPYTSVFLTCEYENAALDFKTVFAGRQGIVGYFFVPSVNYTAPSYADTNAITERAVEVKTGTYILSGILTLPERGDHLPLVVLVHGSGPHDKDETINLNKPFKDLALGLASKGIASLRYDKRTYIYGAKSADDPRMITLKEETVDDAVSAFRLAQTFKEIDKKKIFILGHSLGAIAAPRIAKETPKAAGLIFMAGNARPFEEVIAAQMEYVLPLQLPKKQADSLLELVMRQVERIRTGDFNDSTSGAKLPLGLSPIYWKDIKKYDQVAAAASLKMPMLFLQGENDYQVTMTDLRLWQNGLTTKKNATFISYPGLYHLFMAGQGKPTDYQNADHIAEKVITDISAWILK